MNIDADSRGKRFKTYHELETDYRKLQDHMIKCNCSHTVLFTGRKDRLICSHCGNYIYKDERTKMKYKLKELL